MALTQQQCEQFWSIADKDHNNHLTIQEMKAALIKFDPSLTDCQCAGMFCGVDSNQDNTISKNEFMKEMRDKPARSKHLNDLFRKYDSDNSGELTRKEVMLLIHEYFAKDLVYKIIGLFLQHSDMNKDNIVSKAEFSEFFGC